MRTAKTAREWHDKAVRFVYAAQGPDSPAIAAGFRMASAACLSKAAASCSGEVMRRLLRRRAAYQRKLARDLIRRAVNEQ